MDVCREKHKRIDERLDNHKDRLNNHGNRIDKLEQFRSSTETEIKNLIIQIGDLISIIKWFMGLFGTALIGFFIWYVQTL